MLDFDDELENDSMLIGALVDLRDQLLNPINIKSDITETLLEKVDISLIKLLDVKIINNKQLK